LGSDPRTYQHELWDCALINVSGSRAKEIDFIWDLGLAAAAAVKASMFILLVDHQEGQHRQIPDDL
jgi:hypothetical protein